MKPKQKAEELNDMLCKLYEYLGASFITLYLNLDESGKLKFRIVHVRSQDFKSPQTELPESENEDGYIS